MNVQQSRENQYFDSVLYGVEIVINEVKIIEGKRKAARMKAQQAPSYCAVNASIVEDIDGKKTYRTIDLLVKGEEAKKVLWHFRDSWPTDRMQRSPERWVACVNIGSLRVEAFTKRDGSAGSVLKGRLLKIHGLKIGSETVYGDLGEGTAGVYVAVGNISAVSPEKGTLKFGALDGLVEDPDRFPITIDIDGNADIGTMLSMGIAPRGYEHRETDAKVFAILEIAELRADVFTNKQGGHIPFGRGRLIGVRYLKADDEVIVSGKEKVEVEAVEAAQPAAKPAAKSKAPAKPATKARARAKAVA